MVVSSCSKIKQPKFICNELNHLPSPQVDSYVDLLFIMFIKKKVLEQQIYITSESTQTRVYTIWQLKKKI